MLPTGKKKKKKVHRKLGSHGRQQLRRIEKCDKKLTGIGLPGPAQLSQHTLQLLDHGKQYARPSQVSSGVELFFTFW